MRIGAHAPDGGRRLGFWVLMPLPDAGASFVHPGPAAERALVGGSLIGGIKETQEMLGESAA